MPSLPRRGSKAELFEYLLALEKALTDLHREHEWGRRAGFDRVGYSEDLWCPTPDPLVALEKQRPSFPARSTDA